MDWSTAWLVALSIVNLFCLAYLIVKSREIERGARSALQNVQIQLSFVAGRIGLNNRDLQSAATRAADTEPAPPPEVIGGQQWDDFAELIDRVERGEVTPEETRGAR
jgi:hypothetical protein